MLKKAILGTLSFLMMGMFSSLHLWADTTVRWIEEERELWANLDEEDSQKLYEALMISPIEDEDILFKNFVTSDRAVSMMCNESTRHPYMCNIIILKQEEENDLSTRVYKENGFFKASLNPRDSLDLYYWLNLKEIARESQDVFKVYKTADRKFELICTDKRSSMDFHCDLSLKLPVHWFRRDILKGVSSVSRLSENVFFCHPPT